MELEEAYRTRDMQGSCTLAWANMHIAYFISANYGLFAPSL